METASAHDEEAYVALNLIPGVGPRLQTRLLEHFQTPERVLLASASELSAIPWIGKKILESFRTHNFRDMARRELADCQLADISIVTMGHEAYPASLKEIHDPPLLLYQQGEMVAADQLAVAIVGSRSCTPYGRRIAEQLSGGLARAGVTIISGLAKGIDAVAHRAALQAGGRTIAVCASGLKQIYPPDHLSLAAEITRQGAVISESPLLRQPTRGLFPQRNRIVSGMSLGVVVIEATTTSGTLHTARHAMEQGREVFAVPGPIDSRESEGCHNLIRDGAKLIRHIDDILEELGPLMKPLQLGAPVAPGGAAEEEMLSTPGKTIEIRSPRELNLSEQQTQILNLLGQESVSVDLVMEQAGIEPSRVLSTLTILEMKRLIQRLPGNQLVRIPR